MALGTETLFSLTIKILVVFFLVFANGFFVASEFALVSVRRSRVLTLIEEGHKGASKLLQIINHLDAYLSATQLGITLASLALGWVGEETLAHILLPLFEKILPHTFAVGAAHTAAIVGAFTIITFLHIVLGELAPKSLALVRTETVALMVAWPMELFYKVFKLPISLLNFSGNSLLRMCGIEGSAEHTHTYTKDELRQLVEMSHQGGHLENDELQMMNNIIEFSNIEVREVMTPRTEICAVSDSDSVSTIFEVFMKMGFSRLPVFHQDLDNILGILSLKDLLPYINNAAEFNIAQKIYQPLYIPETAQIADTLRQMQRTRMHMAIIVDEHGGTLGVITLENILEQVVGEINDESDVDDIGGIIEIGTNHYNINGSVAIRMLNRKLLIDIPEARSYTTLAGFLMSYSGRVLKEGDIIEFKEIKFTITKVDRLRVLEVSMAMPLPNNVAT